MTTWLAIAAGGAIGAAARHVLNELVQRRTAAAPFPLGILAVNVVGCLAIGLFAGAAASGRIHPPPLLRSFVVVGVLGGFTTFSSFGLDSFMLGHGGRWGVAAVNVLAHLIAGVGAVAIGFAAGSR
jgi:CrcB protein